MEMVKTERSWTEYHADLLKCIVDELSTGKPGKAGIGGILMNDKGHILCNFFTFVGINNSSETGLGNLFCIGAILFKAAMLLDDTRMLHLRCAIISVSVSLLCMKMSNIETII